MILRHQAVPSGTIGVALGLLLQYLPAQIAMLTLAAAEAVAVGYCATRRELWQARWPGQAVESADA